MYRILARNVSRGPVTEAHPFDHPVAFGFPVVDLARCTACGDCASACPTAALRTGEPAPGVRTLALSYAACVQCRACVEACPAGAIAGGRQGELSAYSRAQLQQVATFERDAATGAWVLEDVGTADGPSLEESAERLRERVRGQLGRSLHVRQVDAGSCNGCELEIAATANPVFDLERFGIHLVASPRHADLLLVTGPVTRNMESAVRSTYEATPEPRVVVAVGACGCSGGVFGEGTYASLGGVDRVLPVDVYIPGCPPRPQAIIAGLLVAMGVRAARAGAPLGRAR